VNGDEEMFVIMNDQTMPLSTPKAGLNFPNEYAVAGIVAVIVAVVLVVISLLEKN
jgi:hypothetical protein